MDDFFYYSFENSFSNTDEWPASAFRNTVETFYEPNNFAITNYKMAKNYTCILTSGRAKTVLLLKLSTCPWTCLQPSQWKVFFVWIGTKPKHYDFYSSKSFCKIKNRDYFWYKICLGPQVFVRIYEEHNG